MKSIAAYVYDVMDKTLQIGEKITISSIIGRLPNEANPISEQAVSSEISRQVLNGLLKKVKRGVVEKLVVYPPRHFSSRRLSKSSVANATQPMEQPTETNVRSLVALALQSATDRELLAEIARRIGQ